MDYAPSTTSNRSREQGVYQRRHRIARGVSTGVAVALLVAVAVYLWLRLPVLETRTVSGEARCASGDAIAGIWVKVDVGDQSGNGFAQLRPASSNPAVTNFSRSLRAKSYLLHVGCGGTRATWGMTAYSPVIETVAPKVVCFDQASDSRYGTCALVDR